MIKIVVLSDTHGDLNALNRLSGVMKESDYVIHLGDHWSDMNAFAAGLGEKLLRVKGNCDVSGGESEILTELVGKRFFITHGHRYRVKSDLLDLSFRAEETAADVVLYGHTHIPSVENDGGRYFINPGSLYNFERTYCYLILENNKIFPKIVKI